MHSVFEERRYLIPFRATLLSQIFTDVLVIGGGVAGMRAAIAASEHSDVILVSKGNIEQSNTFWAQGGIAAVLEESDSFDAHVKDTIDAGGGLCDPHIVRKVVEAGPARIEDLIDWGMRFDKVKRDDSADETIALGREGGHSCHRILHADGDATGKELARTLIRQIESNDRIRFFGECFVLDLITVDDDADQPGRCVGAITHHPKYGLQVIWAKATILASGGCGQVYRESTNPPIATGDGIAMAYRAGATIADMAFVQFHPTTLYVAGASRSLITEAVRGEGAHLIDRNGERFMLEQHDMAELAPRDVVSRAIMAQVAKTEFPYVYLDCRHLGGTAFKERFPGISKLLEKFDIDPGVDPVPIHPSCHYMVGGIQTDDCGRTNVAGLYACGEASATGLHGANRLASNSLLEGLVYGEITGRVCEEIIDEGPTSPARVISDIPISDRAELDLSDVRSSLRAAMWRHVGINRDADQLSVAEDNIDDWASYTLDKIFDDAREWEVQNMLLVGALIVRAAKWREESRGTHYRVDFATTDDEFLIHDHWQRGSDVPISLE